MIYGTAFNGMGDQWAFANWAIHNGSMVVSDAQATRGVQAKYRKGRLREIFDLLDATSPLVTEDLPDERISVVDQGVVYFPTKLQWNGQNRRIVFPPKATHLGLFAPPDEQQQDVFDKLRSDGFEMIYLEPTVPLVENLKTMVTAGMYVGQSTGPAHMAHSAGVPVFLINGTAPAKMAYRCHRNKSFTLCQDWNDFYAAVAKLR